MGGEFPLRHSRMSKEKLVGISMKKDGKRIYALEKN